METTKLTQTVVLKTTKTHIHKRGPFSQIYSEYNSDDVVTVYSCTCNLREERCSQCKFDESCSRK